ncbi:hypothetical protein BC831DRAFT_448591 [Entophlyctis helioformis]|nr:hypothetical protein BC831DRAFT_448591 [Entophlyctis helioformis]
MVCSSVFYGYITVDVSDRKCILLVHWPGRGVSNVSAPPSSGHMRFGAGFASDPQSTMIAPMFNDPGYIVTPFGTLPLTPRDTGYDHEDTYSTSSESIAEREAAAKVDPELVKALKARVDQLQTKVAAQQLALAETQAMLDQARSELYKAEGGTDWDSTWRYAYSYIESFVAPAAAPATAPATPARAADAATGSKQ